MIPQCLLRAGIDDYYENRSQIPLDPSFPEGSRGGF